MDTTTDATKVVPTLEEVNDAAIKKAAEIEDRIKTKVNPLVFKTEINGDFIVGFVKDMPRAIKLRILDVALTSAYTTCGSAVEAYLIAEESDPRILSDDTCYLGACNCLYETVKTAANLFKKK